MDVQDIMDVLTDTGYGDSSVSRQEWAITNVCRDIIQRHPFPFLQVLVTDLTIVSGTVTPTNMPSDVGSIAKLWIPELKITLEPRAFSWVAELDSGLLSNQGAPTIYYFVGDTLYLYPVPNGNYTGNMVYNKKQNKLSQTDLASAIVIPEDYHDVICNGVVAELARLEDDEDVAAVYTPIYEEGIQVMMSDAGMLETDRNDVVEILDDIWAW